MERRKFISLGIGTVTLCCGVPVAGNLSRVKPSFITPSKFSKVGHAMGAKVNLTVYHRNRFVAEAAMDDALAEIERVEQLMSLYRDDSQLSILNKNGALANPHPDLVKVFEKAQELSELTDGAFDVTVQPLWSLYDSCAKVGSSPSLSSINEARAKIGWRNVYISPESIRLKKPGAQITLNGIAQGFAADRARSILLARGITNALIDTGEMCAVGSGMSKDYWDIGIRHPRHANQLLGKAELKDLCIATSGDYETRFSDDFRDNHLFDPRIGRSPTELASVSVAAPSALDADALSTAVFIAGLEKGRHLIESLPGVEALFMTKSGRMVSTSGFPFRSQV